MNEKDAIESLVYLKEELEDDSPDMFTYTTGNIEALKVAINALEKQIPKKLKDRYKTKYIWDAAYCPVCQCGITARWNFCQNCGQSIDWGENPKD